MARITLMVENSNSVRFDMVHTVIKGEKMKKIMLLATLTITLTSSLEAKTIGIYKDARIGNLSGAINTFTNNGWQVTWLNGSRDVLNKAKFDACDAVYFAGGFNRYFYLPFNARRAVIRYAAKGGGVLLTGFRGGYVRSATRPPATRPLRRGMSARCRARRAATRRASWRRRAAASWVRWSWVVSNSPTYPTRTPRWRRFRRLRSWSASSCGRAR